MITKPLALTLREAWIEALESNDYKQGTHWLQRGDAYCCLGVACRVAEQHGVEVIEKDSCLSGTVLMEQPAVYEAFQFAQIGFLMTLNDVMNRSFKEIAEHIKENEDIIFHEV